MIYNEYNPSPNRGWVSTMFNDEFAQIMDEFNLFHIDTVDYFYSMNEQITLDMMNDYVITEGVVTEASIIDTVKNVVRRIIDFISTTWNKFTNIFKKGTDTTSQNCKKAIENIKEKQQSSEKSEKSSTSSTSSNKDKENSRPSTAPVSYSPKKYYKITDRDYIQMIMKRGSNYDKIQDLCVDAFASAVAYTKDVSYDITQILRTGFAYSSNYYKITPESLKKEKKYTESIKKEFKIKNLSDLTNDTITRYILDDVEEKTFEVTLDDALDALDRFEKQIKYLNDFKNKCSSKLNDIIGNLNTIYKNVQKNKDELERYKENKSDYTYDSDNSKSQSAILDYLKYLQKEVSSVLYFNTRAITCKLSILNKAVNLYGGI